MDYCALVDHFVDISLHLHVIFCILLYLVWICHHKWKKHEKTSGFKKSKSLAVFEGSYWHLKFDI